MKIAVVGTGYVGLVTGTCLADFGNTVCCMDVDDKKINNLKDGIIPIYEPGLESLVKKNVKEARLTFSTDIKETVEKSNVIFIAVGTPPKDDGSADLQYVLSVAKDIGRYLNKYTVVVDKSTVPVGTGQLVKKTILEELKKRGVEIEFDVVSNPEFLREGKAIQDFTHPDRVVIGAENEKAYEIMKKVYRVLYINRSPFVFTNIETSETIKYASNAFLAVKISFINELALIAEKTGANIQEIAKAMGMDGRISPKFLHAGPGYGGSCFPKDTKAIADIAKQYGERFLVVESAIEANEKQKMKMVEKIQSKLGDLKGKTLTILGLTFKPDTDDMRDAPSLLIVPELIKRGANIKTFCPQGFKEAKWRLKEYENNIVYSKNEYDAATNSDAIVILTEWNQFRGMDLPKLKKLMSDNFFFDFRNIYASDSEIRNIFDYIGIGIK